MDIPLPLPTSCSGGEDMVLNDEVSDPIPDMFIAGRETAEITAPDEYTINIKYAAPAPLLAERLAMWINGGTGERLIVPAHYLKQFHPKVLRLQGLRDFRGEVRVVAQS